MQILIVDDDAALAKGIALYLRSCNKDFEVIAAADGGQALAALEKQLPDLIILDVMLPDMSGYEICRKIKELGDVPIIFLSSLGEAEDRIKGLNMGGDDYMAKPFRLEELLLRVNARLRERGTKLQEREDGLSYSFGEIRLRKRILTGGVREVALTETEYNILLLLARNEGIPVSLERIHEIVWGDAYNKDLRTVQSHMANLRRKLIQAYGNSGHIATQWGKGYIFQR